MPLTGTLQDLSLANLVQLQCNEQQDAQVTLTRGNRKGTLVFAGGALIAARLDDRTGESAVYELLTWEDGDFRVDNDSLKTERNVTVPWGALVLEGLRLADEARAERDTALEKTMRDLRGKQSLRDALALNSTGTLCAEAKEKNAAEDAALVAFLAGRAETVSSLMGLGSLTSIIIVNPNEKIGIQKSESKYLGGWFDPRATTDQIKTVLLTLAKPH